MTKRKLTLALKDLKKLEEKLDEFQDEYYKDNSYVNFTLNDAIALLSDIITVLEIEHNGTEEDL
jgi:hypothetical protein